MEALILIKDTFIGVGILSKGLVVVCLLTSVTSFVLGFFSFLKNKQNLAWLLFSSCLTFWVLGLGLMIVAPTLNMAKAFLRMHYFGATLIPPTFFHFISVTTSRSERLGKPLDLTRWISFWYIVFAGFLGLSLFSNAIIVDPTPKLSFKYYTEAGKFYWVYTFLFFACIIQAHYFAFRSFWRSQGINRTRLKYILIASLIGFGGGCSAFLPVYYLKIFPYGMGLVMLYPPIIFYAIVAYNLMDIEIVIKKTLVFAGLFMAAYGVFVSFAYLSSVLFENMFRNRWVAIAPAILIVVIILRPLENILRNITDKYLFQKKYDYRKLLRTFSEEVLTVLDLVMLVNLTVNNLAEIMRLENASVFLYDEENGQFYLEASYGNHVPSENMKDSEEFIGYIRGAGRHLLISDPVRKTALNPAVDKKAKELKAELVIPLRHHDGMIGLIIMGKKKSDEDFTQEDIDVILPLTRTLSIAISNAQLFEKLSEAQAQAAQREKMAVIGTLSAGINHEICNPLGIARGQCEMFLLNVKEGIYKERTADELLEKAQEIMQKVINETDRATVITKKLSSFAKPAKGRMQDGVSLKNEIDEVISLIEHDLKLDNIIIEKKVDGEIPLIQADRKQIQEIFFNIIRNAAQSIKGSGRITIRGRSRNRKVFIDIEDTGAGISRNNLDRIFDPFFTTKEPGRGTGLGLFIVKQIAERNNGTISVDSEIGKGSAFHLVFEVEGSVKTPGSRNKAAVSG